MDPPRRWKPYLWFTGVTTALYVAFQVVRRLEIDVVVVPRPWVRPLYILIGVVFWGAVIWGFVVLVRRQLHPRGPGHGPQDLGHPHDVGLELARNGERIPIRLVIGAEGLDVTLRSTKHGFGTFDPPLPERIALADVRALRVEAARLVLDVETAGGPQSLPLFPATYADRQRLIWEMAVRRPELFEGRGAGPASAHSSH
jgi:hypothetical protein